MPDRDPALDPAVQELLTQGDQLSATDWLALLRADQHRRWQAAEPLPAERYLERLPRLQADEALAVDLIWSEVLLRAERGERPGPEEYVRRFPSYAAQLRQQFALEQALAGCQSLPPVEGPGPPATADTVSLAPPVLDRRPPVSPWSTLAPTPDRQRLAAPGAWVQVPGYEILGELGRVGMGVVYVARQVALQRPVALKMILAGAYAADERRARFRAEAEAIARLQHPNIVQVYEVGEHAGLPYFSLEFCAGGSLDRKLAGRPLPPREAARPAETLAGAIHYAHQQHVIHRDLKPANILLQALATKNTKKHENEGENQEDLTGLSSHGISCFSWRFLPKITGFGLARKVDEAGPTQTGDILGTPSYMAPEQAAGRVREPGPALDRGELHVWDVATGREQLVPGGRTSEVRGVAFTADGQRLASAGMDGTITLWDADAGQEVVTLRGHGAAVTAVTFSPDGNWLVSGSMDGDARIWDATRLPEESE